MMMSVGLKIRYVIKMEKVLFKNFISMLMSGERRNTGYTNDKIIKLLFYIGPYSVQNTGIVFTEMPVYMG